ncbi:MAG: DUF3999 domain-containing protein [Gammaproteobacteria bacterium]|nr:DUF3999 domain-containing protein [Gammaproteobacteria bacterium]
MRKGLLAIILLTLAGTVTAEIDPEDYAYRARLSETDQALQRVVLPMDVIINLTHSDFSDLAVFNLDGKQLPHAITRTPTTVIEHNLQLAFREFDRFLQQSSKTVTTREQTQQADSLSELQTTETIAVQSLRKDYLIELSADDKTPDFDRIELTWTHEPAGQILEVRVEAGNELDKLLEIEASKSLTNQQSEDINWRSITGIPRNKKYLRLTPVNDVTSFELQSVRGHYREIEDAPVQTHQLVPEIREQDGVQFYTFEVPSVIRAEAIRIVPADANRVINGDLFGIWGKDETRVPIRSGYRQHNISAEDVKPSKPILLPRRSYQHFWFTSRAELSEPPRVELIYPQYELIFLGDDVGPFTLTWGNYEGNGEKTDLKGILKGDLEQARQRGALVTLGSIREAGGPARLAPPPETAWKKWLLWTVLILAAIVTGRMAFRLYRELNRV